MDILVSFETIFQALQTGLSRLMLKSVNSKIPKFPEFSLRIFKRKSSVQNSDGKASPYEGFGCDVFRERILNGTPMSYSFIVRKGGNSTGISVVMMATESLLIFMIHKD